MKSIVIFLLTIALESQLVHLWNCPHHFRWNNTTGNDDLCAEEEDGSLPPPTNDNDDRIEMLRAGFHLPPCKKVQLPLNSSSIKSTFTKNTLTIKVGLMDSVIFEEFHLSTDNLSINLCYPLSPQLYQCSLQKQRMSNYLLLSNRTLIHHSSRQRIGFGDYYTEEDGDFVISCPETVNELRRLRCNYVHLSVEEYELSLDNYSLHLISTNRTVFNPIYQRKDEDVPGSVRLCFPFTPDFTVCSHLWFLERSEFVLLDDHRLRSLVHGRDYGMGEFFIHRDRRAVVCARERSEGGIVSGGFDVFLIHAALYLLSAACLLVALVLHLLLPSLNYHAKPLLCHMMSTLVLYTSLAVRKFLPGIDNVPGCYVLFVSSYVSALASFFWLSVLAFDMWSIFANLQANQRLGCQPCIGAKSKSKRFWCSCVYAWGVPVLLCVLVLLLDNYPSAQEMLGLRPQIRKMCWFNCRKMAFLTLYGPMFVVLLTNAVFFVLTVVNLRKAGKGTEMVNKKLNRQLLLVCLRLFVVMGLCWVVEAVVWTLDVDVWLMSVNDLVIGLQGVIIFLIYICKPNTYRLLRRHLTSTRLSRSSTDTRWTSDGQSSRHRHPHRSLRNTPSK